MKTFTRTERTVGLIAWLLVTLSAPLFASNTRPDAWYAALTKPSFNPPSWIFGPVWTLLYTLMAIAAWIVWKRGGFRTQARPLTAYLVQLALNAVWTPVFFGMHRLDIAFGIIVLLWIGIAITLRLFWSVQKSAGILIVPYLAWVGFASFLNFTLLKLNS